jgi:hypothetical protein
MRIESRGTYHLLYEDVHRHPKTRQLAQRIRALLPTLQGPDGLVMQVCRAEAVAQLHRLCCWACRESESGEVGHLDPDQFAFILQWRDADTAPQLLRAWVEAGFLDARDGSLFIHDWDFYASPLIKNRQRMRKIRSEQGAQDRAQASRTLEPVLPFDPSEELELAETQSEAGVQQACSTSGARVQNMSRTCAAPRVRATEIGYRNAEYIPPPSGGLRAGARDTHTREEGGVLFSHTTMRQESGTCHAPRAAPPPVPEPPPPQAATPKPARSSPEPRAAPSSTDGSSRTLDALLEPLKATLRDGPEATDPAPNDVMRGWHAAWAQQLRALQLAEPTREERAQLSRVWSGVYHRHGGGQRATSHVDRLIAVWFGHAWGARTGFAPGAFCRAINELEMSLRAPPPSAPRTEVVNGVEVRLTGQASTDHLRRAAAGAIAIRQAQRAEKARKGGPQHGTAPDRG